MNEMDGYRINPYETILQKNIRKSRKIDVKEAKTMNYPCRIAC